jgi:TonB family protein
MKPLFLLLILIPALSMSQKLKVNEYDKFTKERRLEMEPIQILASEKASINLTFSALGTGLYVQFSGYGWAATNIDPGEKTIFLFSNDSTVTVSSTALQTYEMVLSSLRNTYKHTYFITEAALRSLSENTVTGIRKYGSNEFFDMKVSNDKAEKIKKASALFIEELKKAKMLRSLKDINITDISKHIGDSVRFCSKVYNSRFFESSANKPTLLDVNNSFGNQSVNLVIWEQDRKNFANAPESLYLKKDICVSGVVELYNNAPQIVIRNRGQIIVKTPIGLHEIQRFIGDSVTVSGKVMTGKVIETSQNSPTHLNMGAAYPDQLLTLVIDNKDRVNFSSPPESYYLNKQISVSGRVERYGDMPQIVVKDKSQITELPDTAILPVEQPYQRVQAANQPNQGIQENKSGSVGPTSSSPKNVPGKSASFPGGQAALQNFLKNNLICPQDQLKMGERKVVVAKFLITPDGKAENIQITQPGGTEFDKEVIRVLKKMPKWEPQIENGVPVPISVTQPVTFFRQQTGNKARG